MVLNLVKMILGSKKYKIYFFLKKKKQFIEREILIC